jgi:SAM-dependent methyltransferase
MTRASDFDRSAQATYDAYAPAYDAFNHGYMYKRWTGRLLAAAERVGLRGNRLLDIGCGTGLSFIPMLSRGWTVTACDISLAMLEVARTKEVGTGATLHQADMRALPVFGEFDLVWAVNDAVNYLLTIKELEEAMSGMQANLAECGFIVFDVNTLTTYKTFFSSEHVVENGGRRFVWRGQMSAEDVTPGSVSEARFEAEGEEDLAHVHRQRHFAECEVLAAVDTTGLRCVAVLGELDGALEPGLDERVHTKAVYICAR